MSKIICIDPGHGGYDPGACANGAREKDITLHIGLQLRDLLRKAGFQVVMTRESDVSPGGYTEVNAELQERCRISNEAKTDTFLSIHVNAGGGHGAEIYAAGDGGPITGLAHAIISNVSTVCGTHGQAVRDGGPNGEGWAVICGTHADAMLLEVGFIDSSDLQKIQARIDEFAPLIAHAFCDFYDVTMPEGIPAPMNPSDAYHVIAALGWAFEDASDDVKVALNFAANSLRKASCKPVAESLGTPSQSAAQEAIDFLGALWNVCQFEGNRAAIHFAADALRDAVGIAKN